tara:strand:- start:1079 stop:1288 length:210 start_codon:yes stop_codon:yes gene_type:complete
VGGWVTPTKTPAFLKMFIDLEIRDICGTERLFVTNHDQAEAIQKLTRRKSLQRSDIDALTKLGFQFTGL